MLLEGKPVAEKIKKDIMTAVRGAKKMQGKRPKSRASACGREPGGCGL